MIRGTSLATRAFRSRTRQFNNIISRPFSVTLQTLNAQKILVVGGSYAGITAVKTLLKLTSSNTHSTGGTEAFAPKPGSFDPATKFEITLIDPRSGFINIMAIPKMIFDPKFAESSYVPVSKYGIQWDSVKLASSNQEQQKALSNPDAEHHTGTVGEKIVKSPNVKVNFVQGYVTSLEPHLARYVQKKFIKNKTPPEFLTDTNEKMTATKENGITFDYCILASGRSRNWPFDPLAVSKSEFIKEITKFRSLVDANEKFTVIGGGALGIEVAGELRHSFPNKTVQLVHPHASLPPEPLLSDEYKERMVSKIREVGIDLKLNTRIKEEIADTETGNLKSLVTTTGEKIDSDLNLWCNYHRNNITYLQNETFKGTIIGKDEVSVNENLQVQTTSQKPVVFNHIFSVGDLPNLGVIKKAGGAFRTAEIAANNVISLVTSDNKSEVKLQKFPRERWPLDKMAIVIGSNNNVQSMQGKIFVDNPKIVNSYKDYKNAKVAKRLGLQVEPGEPSFDSKPQL